MNFYTALMTRTLDYIENNIEKVLTPSSLAYLACISEFHFQRLFKAVCGISCGKYILGRKLTRAAFQLKTTAVPVTELALDMGFEYPEVFSRAFKKQFGISPRTYRSARPDINEVKVVQVVERDFSNFKGVPSIKGDYIRLEKMVLAGETRTVCTDDEDFEKNMNDFCLSFLEKSKPFACLDHSRFYSTVSCHGEGTNTYTVLFGKTLTGRTEAPAPMTPLRIPPGWYCKFVYQGEGGSILPVLIEDIYRWIALREVKLDSDSPIGMLTSYSKDYFQDKIHTFLIPVIH